MRKISVFLLLTVSFACFAGDEAKVTVCLSDLHVTQTKEQPVNINADKMTDKFIADFKDSQKVHYVAEKTKKK